LAYHVLNRAAGKAPVFAASSDAGRFVGVLAAAVERSPAVGLLAWCLMPNHWHLVFYPSADDSLQPFLQWLTQTHVQRHRAVTASVGQGHLYQGRYRSFPIAADDHLLIVLRYVERNPVRAGLVSRAGDWPWSSASWRSLPGGVPRPALTPWPIERPADWPELVDRPLTAAEEEDRQRRIQGAVARGRPFGPANWVATTAATLGLGATLGRSGARRR